MSVFKTDAEGIQQEVSRETKPGDIEGYRNVCICGHEATLVPVDMDTADWIKLVCPMCFESDWIRVYE